MQIKDVSNLSGDHAISLDSLSSEQIEVVRGPETIIYGGGAVGGVVNIIDYRIHPEFIDGIVVNTMQALVVRITQLLVLS